MDEDLTNRLERALLGALITDPDLVPRLEYLERSDFADHLHRVVYMAIQLLRDAPETSAGDRAAAIVGVAGPHVTEEYVRELAASCPDPRHGTAYGLRLVPAALYRQMVQRADAIGTQAALPGHETARVTGAEATGGLNTRDVTRHLWLVSDALRRQTGSLTPIPPATAAQSPAAPPDRPASDQELREEHVLTAFLQQHPESDQILAYLPAAAFTSPERQEIFRGIRRLRSANEPVDEITVAWELTSGSDFSGQPHGSSGLSAAYTSVMRLASATDSGQSPAVEARNLLSQLERRTPPGWRQDRHAQPGQAPGQAGLSANAGLPAPQAPESAGPQQGREPRR